ncbi:MAG: IS110 family transposase [Chloroflexi bacterium]|nr:IS110 family transposase [Chloroflexota bacterium]
MSTFERYLALDVHKHYVVVGGVNAQQQVILPPRRLDLGEWAVWMPKHLHPTDAVVLEATTNAWTFYDQVAPLAGRTVVAHPGLVKVIASARVKTDNRDVLHLARLLAANLIPEVWVPPQEVRELRALLAHRRRLIKMRTMTRNRLNSVIHRYNLTPPRGELFLPKHRAWWLNLKLSPTEKLRIRQDLATLDHLEPEIVEVDAELHRLSTVAPWDQHVRYLMQMPGFGIIVVMTVLAAIGDVTRFPSAKKLVGYAGLGASVHASGETYRTGRITKSGRKDLRWTLRVVEAARIAVLYHDYWKQEYAKLEKRLGTNKAIVVIARTRSGSWWCGTCGMTARRIAMSMPSGLPTS